MSEHTPADGTAAADATSPVTDERTSEVTVEAGAVSGPAGASGTPAAATDGLPDERTSSATVEAAAVSASGAATSPTPPNVADIEEAMRDVVDPELGINVVDLGLVYGITVDAHSNAVVDMTLTSAACPLTDVIEDQTAQALEGLVPSHRINWVWMPPWGPDKITEDGREQLRALGFNV